MSAVAPVALEQFRWLVVVASICLSALILAAVAPDRRGTDAVRTRLLLGVPWGTVLTIGFVLSVYLFVQGGLEQPRRPLVVPFRSWSYFYPLGMVTAAFSHGSWSHLVGNLVGTAAYAGVAEYVWGHYPRRRGVQSFVSPLANPYVRILTVPVASIAVGLFTALFAFGPVVGFSGVVFAYAGFALVQRPVLGVLAILGGRVLNTAFSAVTNPQTVTSPRPRVVTPWWADVAIQGHAIGLLAGILIAVALARSREEWPDPCRVWFALLAFAVFQGLWAVYAPVDGGRYVLYRWAGVSVVFLLAPIVVLGTSRVREFPVPALDISGKSAALVVIVVLLAALSASAVLTNVAPIDRQPGPEPSVTVGGYDVGYAEDVRNGYASSIRVPVVGYSPQINTSGVIVTNPDRYVWRAAIHPARLENQGRASVLVGGLGWQERVYATRPAWKLTGGGETYQVFLEAEGQNRTLAFSSDPADAEPTIDGRNVSMRPVDDRFEFVVSRRNQTVGTAAVPANGTSVTTGGLTFHRDGRTVYASANRTRVQIARKNEV